MRAPLAAVLTVARARWLADWLATVSPPGRYPNKFTPAPGGPDRGLRSGTDTDKRRVRSGSPVRPASGRPNRRQRVSVGGGGREMNVPREPLPSQRRLPCFQHDRHLVSLLSRGVCSRARPRDVTLLLLSLLLLLLTTTGVGLVKSCLTI